MTTLTAGSKGLNLIFALNADLLLYVATILTALAGGAFLGTLLG